MSDRNELSGAYLDLIDGRADLPRIGSVRAGSSPSLPYLVVDGADREIEPVSRYLRDLQLSDVSPLTGRSYLVACRQRAIGEGWRGEIEGLELTLKFLRSKRLQAQRAANVGPVGLGMPGPPPA